ncbi:MAG: monoamine oxidase [Myxococcota bacterium]|jgi:monoamine oxidase
MSTRADRRRAFRRRYPHAIGRAVPLPEEGLEGIKPRRRVRIPPGQGKGKSAVVVGAGVGGLCAAYELLKAGFEVTVIEARDRIGGRCLTLRSGDVLEEDRWPAQQCTFKNEPYTTGQQYLNAGPGRIPSGHTHLLKYLKEFRVDLEVYVMNTGANHTYVSDGFDGKAQTWRQLDNDTRGRLAADLYAKVASPEPDTETARLMDLLITFGALEEDGSYGGSSRSGYLKAPGIEPGIIASPLELEVLLDSEFWKETSFYQPNDYLWQSTLFQPVGGMDRVAFAFYDNVIALGGKVLTSSPVTRITRGPGGKWRVTYTTADGEQTVRAHVCVSNAPIPLLDGVLDDSSLDPSFRGALKAVYDAQTAPGVPEEDRFLAPTTKVGWQAERALWQEPDAEENRSVPIYGGISWTDAENVQIWYPSSDVHAHLGVLTGAYNFDDIAVKWGDLPPESRLRLARDAAADIGGHAFAAGLGEGVAIAWQNIPYLKGGWSQWEVLDLDVHADADGAQDAEVPGDTRSARMYNALVHGSNGFFIVGDQLSELHGWQEGAVISALNAVRHICVPDYRAPRFARLANSRLSVGAL